MCSYFVNTYVVELLLKLFFLEITYVENLDNVVSKKMSRCLLGWCSFDGGLAWWSLAKIKQVDFKEKFLHFINHRETLKLETNWQTGKTILLNKTVKVVNFIKYIFWKITYVMKLHNVVWKNMLGRLLG